MLGRRAFLIGATAGGAVSALLPSGVEPYPVPPAVVPEGLKAHVIEHGGLYLVTLHLLHQADLVRIGCEGYTLGEWHDVREAQILVGLRPGKTISATAFGSLDRLQWPVSRFDVRSAAPDLGDASGTGPGWADP